MIELKRKIEKPGKTREGIFTLQVWQEGEPGCPTPKGPREHLEDIIKVADGILKDLPGPDDHYTIHPDGTFTNHGPQCDTKALAREYGSVQSGCPTPSTDDPQDDRHLVEPCSAEYFAWNARDHAHAALAAMDSGDMLTAVDKAMSAVSDFENNRTITTWEEEVVQARSSKGGRRGARKKGQPWAGEAAKLLTAKHPGLKPSELLSLIPRDSDADEEGLDIGNGLELLVIPRENKSGETVDYVVAQITATFKEEGAVAKTTFQKKLQEKSKIKMS